MAVSIIPRVERGRLYFQTADLLVPTFIQAAGCRSAVEALKFRLMRAAESLDAMVLLAVRGFDLVEQLEQQLAARTAGR